MLGTERVREQKKACKYVKPLNTHLLEENTTTTYNS
jgi:hypothetical protein